MLGLKNSYIDLLAEVYPEFDWLPWKFSSFNSKILVSNANRRQNYIEWMSKQLNIKEMNDWYKIKPEVNFGEISQFLNKANY